MNVRMWIVIYYALISLVLLAAMGLDKRRASARRYRIPEKALFMLSCLGGGIGGLFGMLLFRHKTRKPAFWAVFILTSLAHLALAYRLLLY